MTKLPSSGRTRSGGEDASIRHSLICASWILLREGSYVDLAARRRRRRDNRSLSGRCRRCSSLRRNRKRRDLEAGVLPIDVEAVEVVFGDEVHRAIDEDLAALLCQRGVGEVFGPGPATYRDEDLEVGVLLFQSR